MSLADPAKAAARRALTQAMETTASPGTGVPPREAAIAAVENRVSRKDVRPMAGHFTHVRISDREPLWRFLAHN